MRKNLAIRIGKDVVWEFPLGPFAKTRENEELLSYVKSESEWSDFTDAEEPDGWRDFEMEIREYAD